ncbi:VENN motif pre-toxin domain-containing protein, partial [Gilliamella sp. B2838]|uniref:VENN motif pre-toxin domain-containing protein n=1 Tax=Gilliamella sp. B2838 TaxID=2818020 RepID=UPI00226A5DB4
RGAEVIASILYPNKSIDELNQDEKQQVSALAQLATGLTIAALGGDAQDINTAIAGGKNAVENNLLSNKRGVEKLDKDGKKLHEKIKNIVGVDEVDKLEEKYNECKTDECRKDVYNEYIQKEQEAGKKLYELYQSGNLSADEYFQLVSSYASSMLEGIQEGQTDNAKNHRFMNWDIYDASGSDWIPSNIISNPYLSGVRGLILLKQWRAEGLSESQIQERFLKDNILGAFGSGPDINEIVHQVRNSDLSVDDALRLATLTVYGKVTDNASKGKNVTGKGTDANKPLDKTDLELQHGKGNVEQGGGNYKETKDKILDNQDTNQKANESSNFGEHVKKEQEINSGKGANSTSSNPIINPATNKVVTEHIIVPSGKAPKTSTPNSIYEVSRSDGSRSVTYYDERGNMFSREDYGQQRIHGNLEFDNNGKVVPHEHKQTYKSHNGKIYKDKSYYRQIDENGKPVGPWILDK